MQERSIGGKTDTDIPHSVLRLKTPVAVAEPLRGPTSTQAGTSLPEDAAARRIVEALVERGVDTFFGIPGGPACALFEAVRVTHGARLIASRHETHAGLAAATFYRVTRRIPALIVTAGPGITHAVTGIASASFERIPMLVLAGDAAWATRGGRLAQDSGPEGLDAEQLLSSITRAQIRIARPSSAVPQTLAALDAASDPSNPGPALVVLPMDRAMGSAPFVRVSPRPVPAATEAPLEAVRSTARWLREAEHPLLVLGSATRLHADSVKRLVDVLQIPFVTTPSAKGVVSEAHPLSLRNGGMAASMWARRYTAEPVDCALVLGTDLDDTSMGPTPYLGPEGRLVHVDLDSRVFARNVPTELGVVADLGAFARQLSIVASVRSGNSWTSRLSPFKTGSPFDEPFAAEDLRAPIAPHRAVLDIEAAAPAGTRFITDIGEHMLFALHYLTARAPDRFFIQLGLGSMGSGIAGAIGLAVADPLRPVICICGDGGMQMSGAELLLAKKLNLPIIFAVFNDGRYNMVYHGMKQLFGDGEQWDMPATDFALVAASMGVPAMVVERPGEITAARLATFLSFGGPALLDVRIDPAVRIRGGGRVEALHHMSMLGAKAAI